MIFATLIFNLFLAVSSIDKFDVTGTYSLTRHGQPNSTIWSTTTLKVNCDSTVVVHRRTHGGQRTWEGFWTVKKDTLTINLKPIVTEDGKQYLGSWENVNQFLIRKNRLTPFVTMINGKEINDENLLERLNRSLKKDRYKKINEKKCS